MLGVFAAMPTLVARR